MDGAVRHYHRWTTTRFRPWRIYWITLASVLPVSLAVDWWVADKTGEPFAWAVWWKVTLFVIVASTAFIAGMRKVAVAGSWLIVNEAKGFLLLGNGIQAWHVLAAKYRGMHPIVINHSDFRQLLATALAKARAAGDAEADRLLAQELSSLAPNVSVRCGTEFTRVDEHSRKAARFVVILIVLLGVVMLVRIVSFLLHKVS